MKIQEAHINMLIIIEGFPGGLDGKESTCNAGNLSSIPGLERLPGEGSHTLVQIPLAPQTYRVVQQSGCLTEGTKTYHHMRVQSLQFRGGSQANFDGVIANVSKYLQAIQ